MNTIPSQDGSAITNVFAEDPEPNEDGEFETPLAGALFMAAKGIPQIPLRARSKVPCIGDWPSVASCDPAVIEAWGARFGDCNFGSVSVLGSHFVFEADSPEVKKRFDATGEKFSSQLIVESSPGKGHRYYRGVPGISNISQSDTQRGDFSVRADRQFCVSPGSIHPTTGKQYRLFSKGPLVEPTQAEIAFWNSERKSQGSPSKPSCDTEALVILDGQRNDSLFKIGARLRRDGATPEEIETILSRINVERCETPLDAEEIRQISNSEGRYAPAADRTLLLNGAEPGTSQVAATSQAAEITRPNDAKITIPCSEEMFYGLAGRIIKRLQPETESHPVGNLLQLLAAFGNIVGPTAYYVIEDTKHFTNINTVRVGKSSKSRKGTGQARIERIAAQLDSTWFTSRNTSGLGSGEVVIWEVRDAVIGPVKDKKTGEANIVQIDPGVTDKRLFISEGEFAGVLAVAGRKDSILSTVIRNAWDHKALRNKVKGSPAVCLDPHISISADITRDELLKLLSDSDRVNGFGNRFLWCFVERQGLKPFGGEDIDWSNEIVELYKAVEFTRAQRRIFMDRGAREKWDRIYEDLSEDVPGVVGAVISRGEAQVIRLALIFAMLDLSEHITAEHLKAALALWQYCDDSARIIFGGITKAHNRIVEFLRTGPKTIQEFREVLFAKNRKVEEIRADLDTLAATGKVYLNAEAGVERFHLIGS